MENMDQSSNDFEKMISTGKVNKPTVGMKRGVDILIFCYCRHFTHSLTFAKVKIFRDTKFKIWE